MVDSEKPLKRDPIAPASLPRARLLAEAARQTAAKLGDLQLARAAAALAQRVKDSEQTQQPPTKPNSGR